MMKEQITKKDVLATTSFEQYIRLLDDFTEEMRKDKDILEYCKYLAKKDRFDFAIEPSHDKSGKIITDYFKK